MPEGPEIRLAADEVEAALVGRAVERIWFAFAHLRRFERRLQEGRVIAVETRGKAMLTHFDSGWTIYSHNQLYGRWYVVARDQLSATGRQLRLALHNDQYSVCLYSASDIDVIRSDKLGEHPFLSRLGPDILNQNPSTADLVERMQSSVFARRQLGALLLDQRFVAGLGNYLRAEILTLAKLHPNQRAVDCTSAQLRRLANQIIKITRRSYRTRGIVNPPALVARLKSQGMTRREEHRFNTYGRAGDACHYCNAEIQFNLTGGRKMYFCPGCQPDIMLCRPARDK